MLHMEKGQEYDFSDGFVVMVLAQSVLQSSVVKMSSLGHLKTCTCLQEAQVQETSRADVEESQEG